MKHYGLILTIFQCVLLLLSVGHFYLYEIDKAIYLALIVIIGAIWELGLEDR